MILVSRIPFDFFGIFATQTLVGFDRSLARFSLGVDASAFRRRPFDFLGFEGFWKTLWLIIRSFLPLYLTPYFDFLGFSLD